MAHRGSYSVSTRFLGGALGLALAAPVVLGSLGESGDGELVKAGASVLEPDVIDFQSVGLSELRAKPTFFLGTRVQFVLQFEQVAEDWNPFFSRFGPADWMAVRGWADEEFTWHTDVYENPAARIFARRGSRAAQIIDRTRTYSRLRVNGVVREVFGGEPWIEIEAVETLKEEVGEGSILHVERALTLIEQGQFELALAQLQRAKAAPLPLHARAEIERIADEAVKTRDEIEALRKTVR